jgi:hypothetical protein
VGVGRSLRPTIAPKAILTRLALHSMTRKAERFRNLRPGSACPRPRLGAPEEAGPGYRR